MVLRWRGLLAGGVERSAYLGRGGRGRVGGGPGQGGKLAAGIVMVGDDGSSRSRGVGVG